MSKQMLSEKQKKFLKDDLRRINLLYGSVRSGKTYISLLKWAIWIGQQSQDKQFLMVGKTITKLKRNCLVLLEELIGDNITYSISQKKAVIFGRTVWLEGANDERSESKIRGMTLQGCYVDELTQIPQDFYLMALSRLSEKGAVFLATTNPDHPKHYVKTEIIDNDKLDKQVIKFLLDDNIFLDETYKENLKKEYNGVYYERFINGNFIRAEGLVFPDIANNLDKYIISKEEASKQYKNIGVGYDLGGNKSNFALICTGITADNMAVVLRGIEIVPEELNLADVERIAIDFIEGVERDYNAKMDKQTVQRMLNKVRYCYIDDNYYTTVNSLNNWRYIFDSAARIKSTMPLEDRPLMLNKLMAQGRFKMIEGECEPLIEQLENAVFDDRAEKAIICDDGSMNIDCIDAFFYSIAEDYLYLTD